MYSASRQTNFKTFWPANSRRSFAAKAFWARPWPVENRTNKSVRIRCLGPYLSSGRLKFKSDSPGTRLLVEQLKEFPIGDHDDGPDAAEMALRLAAELLAGRVPGTAWAIGCRWDEKRMKDRNRSRFREEINAVIHRSTRNHNMQDTNHSQNERIDNTSSTGNSRLMHLECRLLEAFDEMWDSFVDPTDAFYDVDGTHWNGLGGAAGGAAASGIPFTDEQQLAEIRGQCRALAAGNEFAINGHENRISYIVGSGHVYRAVARKGHAAPESLLNGVQAVLDEFAVINHWHKRQQEIVLRKDRDGECFLRLFPAPDGTTRLRFVEPDQIAAPADRAGDASASFGVETDAADVETVIGYWIDGHMIDAGEIQHRKANVDANVKRGLPLFYPVRRISAARKNCSAT